MSFVPLLPAETMACSGCGKDAMLAVVSETRELVQEAITFVSRGKLGYIVEESSETL